MTEREGYPKPGDRVLVFPADHIDEESREMRIYGVGIYEGDFIPPEDLMVGEGGIEIEVDEKSGDINISAEGGEEESLDLAASMRNPRIRLDNGQVVWGYEVFFTSLLLQIDGEDRHPLELAVSRGFTVKVVDINAKRVKSFGLDSPEAQN